MLDPKTKARIAQEAENWIKIRQIYTPKGCVNHYIAGAEAEAERAQGEWIRVDDRLPEFNQEVLVYGKRRLNQPTMDGNPPKVVLGMRQDLSGSSIPKREWLRYADKNNFRMMEEVTHWRPLPDPPHPIQ